MAGLIASGVIKWTARKLPSLVSAPIGSSQSDEQQTSAISDVQALQRTMATVQRTLGVMDEDNIRDESGRLRLRELQQFAYDAQDAIDKYKFELLRRMMDDPNSNGEDRSTCKRKRKGKKENFDLKNIMSKIIMSFTRKPCQITELDQLEYMLMDQVAGRKFLLVLDDVWSERKDLWDALLSPMSAAQLGAILVTTRNVNVSSVIQTMAPYHVGCLPFDESWQIFKQMAFGHLDQNIEKAFEEIGRKIVQKCGGLPLAVEAIGSVLRFEENEEKWSDILDSELWDLPTGEDTVLPALRLSYVRTPIDLKRCFVLFTLFPKGHIFMKENVVYLWISLGILKQNNHRHLENIGNQYFDDLLQRTMVQRVQIDGGHNCFTIHDLFLDLAKFVSVNGSIRILQVINAMDDNKMYCSSLFKNNRRCFSKLFSHHINITLPEDLRGLRHLRALDLSRSSLTSLPESIGELKLLRYLSIFQTRIAKLPESICGLYNLKVLDARTNMLGEIPQGIQKLVSLQHLSLDLWSPLCMPRGIGELKKLKTLTRYSVGTGNWHCNIAELHHLVNIHGELSFTGLSRVTNINDAQTANLVSKRHLQILRLDWSAGFYATECEHTVNENNATSTPEFEEEVFESLKPQRNLEELEVVEYSGNKYPSWMGDPAFSRLAKVTLWKQKCKFLPALGQLPQLHELVVIHMEGVERIGQEFYGQDSTKRFPALELLEFQDMPKWVEWYDIAESDFPSLRELKIKDSNELRVLPQKLPAHLKKLVITNCEKLIRLPIAPSLTSLVLKGNIHEETLSCLHFPLLRTLKVCFLRTAKFIKLENMPMLEGLAIVGCRQLFSVAGLSNLESLSLLNIKGCPNLHLPFEPLPQKVQQSTVTNCPQLQEWTEWQQAQMPKHEHQLQEPDGASYNQEVLNAIEDDSEDDFEGVSEDEDDCFYDSMLDVGESSGMAID
ncbi:unnamed protein product [Miscanthus lutarioriparius]|uniref:NB-ARC domain-containing protein n=1 Tax=Miscanthus lutarioriparius TaxID=422564 RepID=A0A811MJJ9_9POAL|nr:unnamed protein product [Miscanthus lutarioriparius]